MRQRVTVSIMIVIVLTVFGLGGLWNHLNQTTESVKTAYDDSALINGKAVDITEKTTPRIKSYEYQDIIPIQIFDSPKIDLNDYTWNGIVRGKVIGIEYDQIVMESGNPFTVLNNTEKLELGSELTLACYENSKTYYETCLIRSIDKKLWTYDEEMEMLDSMLQNSRSVSERHE